MFELFEGRTTVWTVDDAVGEVTTETAVGEPMVVEEPERFRLTGGSLSKIRGLTAVAGPVV